MVYEIKSHQGAFPLKFGMIPNEVIDILGEPRVNKTNSLGDKKLHYIEVSLTFDRKTEGLVEIGFSPNASLWLQGIDLFHDTDALQKVIALDGAPFEWLGFLIFLNLGITMTGFHDNDPDQKAVTVFTQGRWDSNKDKFQKFQLNT